MFSFSKLFLKVYLSFMKLLLKINEMMQTIVLKNRYLKYDDSVNRLKILNS